MLLSLTDATTKAEIRAYCKQRRAELSECERAEHDAMLCHHLSAYLEDFETVLSFYPAKGEPNILPVLRTLTEQGKHLCLPLTCTDPPALDFFEIKELQTDLVAGAFGIPAPRDGLDAWRQVTKGAVCIVPALAFDMQGFRVGYGKGFYDRFLCGRDIATVGVCYSEFLANKLPFDKNDISVDIIITEKGVISSRVLKTE